MTFDCFQLLVIASDLFFLAAFLFLRLYLIYDVSVNV